MILTLLLFHTSAAGSVQPLPPVTDADGRLGLCDVLPGAPATPGAVSWAEMAYDSGARVNRWEFRWDRLEHDRDRWDYTADDAAVKDASQAGLDVLGILIGTPEWAAAPGQRPGNGVPKGLYLPYDDPRNLWATYVRQTVNHYQGEVQYWEVWNEPDLHFFWMGSPDDYFRMLKVAYLTIHSAQPQTKVLMAGMVVPDQGFVKQVLQDANHDSAGKDNHGYLDAAAWHIYGPARLAYTDVLRFRGLLGSAGYANIPLWVTEDGFPASNPNGEPRQAAYVLQTVAYALAAGASRVLVYRASDDRLPKTWGLITATGAPRMGYVAFQVAAEYFSHSQAITHLPTPDLEQFVFYGPNRRVTLLWNRGTTDKSVMLSPLQPGAEMVDWLGKVSPLAVSNGKARLVVPGAFYNTGVDPGGSVVGGPPVLIVEDNTQPVGLGSSRYFSPAPGANRRLVIVNHSDTLAAVQVSVVTPPGQRAVLQVPPHAVETINLDLLAGTAYRGMYSVASTAQVTTDAVSTGFSAAISSPAATWFMAVAPSSISLGNPTHHGITARLTAYGPKGAVRMRERVQLKPFGLTDWTPPSELLATRFALAVRADAPVVVTSVSRRVTPVPQPQRSWYALRLRARGLSIFNPDSRVSTQVDVRFVGSTTLRGEQLTLRPHHSFTLQAESAKALVVQASRGVAADYVRNAQPAPPLAGESSVKTVLAVAGEMTRVAVFNPSPQAAHLNLSLLGGPTVQQSTRILAAGHVSTFQVRQRGGPAEGVVLSADVPVVAVPAV